MKISSILIVCFLLATFWSCKEESFSDPNYPTIIKALSNNELKQIASQLGKTPMAEYTVIDTFGIPYMKEKYDDSLSAKDWQFSANKEELIQMTKEAIVEYGNFLNITDSSKISIRSISTIDNTNYDSFISKYTDSLPTVWKVTTNQQLYNGFYVKGSSLNLIFSPNGLVGCSGHWYNNIYTPESMNYTEERAKESILGKRLSYKSTTLITNEETSWHTSQKVILPLRHNSYIELRVCWALYPGSWEIIIDSESGNILSAINLNKL